MIFGTTSGTSRNQARRQPEPVCPPIGGTGSESQQVADQIKAPNPYLLDRRGHRELLALADIVDRHLAGCATRDDLAAALRAYWTARNLEDS